MLSEKERKRKEAEQRQRRYERTKPVQEEIATLERTIETAEAEKKELERMMGDPDFYKDGERVKEITVHYKTLEKNLSDEYYRWNELTRELERLQGINAAPGDER